MERVVELTVEEGGERLDKYIAQAVPDLSRAAVQRLIKDGRVTVGDAVLKASYRVESGDRIAVHIPPPETDAVQAESIPLDIVYEDDDLLVINKPAGMVVHPAYGHHSGTLVNALLAHCPQLATSGEDDRPGIVHRLDKDTSGLIVVAKHDAARQHLQHQFKQREVEKVYLALVEGRLEPPQGIIEAPIGRDPRRRKRMAVLRSGREARTEYTVAEYFDQYTLVEAHPHTGRTHQIRVHLAFIGHPVAGDRVYGRRKQRLPLQRQFLHAHRLAFRQPSSGEVVEVEAPLPPDLAEVLARLRLDG